MRIKSFFFSTAALLLIFALVSCASTPTSSGPSKITREKAYYELYQENPSSILVMPPINKSTNVDAKEYFYVTLPSTLAKSGYYVFPTFLTMQTLQHESAYDSEKFIDGDVSIFRKALGADAVMFTQIDKWEKHGVKGNVQVSIRYMLKSTKTNTVLFDCSTSIVLDTSVDTGLQNLKGDMALVGLLVNATATAIKTAATQYVALARSCNERVLGGELPYGPYHRWYQEDYDVTAYNASLYTSGGRAEQIEQGTLTPPSVRVAKSTKQAETIPPASQASAALKAELASDFENNFVLVEGDGKKINAFYMSKTEVTQADYLRVITLGSKNKDTLDYYNPSTFKGDNLPVHNVSYSVAALYCNQRSLIEGLTPVYAYTAEDGTKVPYNAKANGYRLATLNEWVYAAQGGSAKEKYKYSGSDDADEVAWHIDNSNYVPQKVATKKPNSLGIYDMSGNVREWVYGVTLTGPGSGEYGNLYAGGSFMSDNCEIPKVVLGSPGYWALPAGTREIDIGFRVVRTKE